MHTWEHGRTRFVGNGDLSGQITMWNIPQNFRIGDVPGEDLAAFVAERQVERVIDQTKEGERGRAVLLAKQVLRLQKDAVDQDELTALARQCLDANRRAGRAATFVKQTLSNIVRAQLGALGMDP